MKNDTSALPISLSLSLSFGNPAVAAESWPADRVLRARRENYRDVPNGFASPLYVCT